MKSGGGPENDGRKGQAVTISVVVVNWNSKDDLRDCLVGLAQQTDRDFEIVVVDNGSTDGSLEMLHDDFPRVVVVDAGTNLGFAEGCNYGIQKAGGSWIAMLNNDAVASADWIAALRQAASLGGPRLGMIQSRILFKHDPTTLNSTGVLIYRDGRFIDRSFNEAASANETTEEIFCASAGAALYRRAMLDELRLDSGIFDRAFFMYCEDVDLGWRARLAGWLAFYEPTATVYHAFHGSASRRGQNFVRLQVGKNRLRTVLKNASKAYIARSSKQILEDLVWSIGQEGLRAISEYFDAGRDGLRQRKAVAEIARSDRRGVELDWVADGGRLAATRGNS